MTYQSECFQKVRYWTRKDAKRAIRQMSHRDHKRLDAYSCTFCPFFHVGHHHPNARMHAHERRRSPAATEPYFSQGD